MLGAKSSIQLETDVLSRRYTLFKFNCAPRCEGSLPCSVLAASDEGVPGSAANASKCFFVRFPNLCWSTRTKTNAFHPTESHSATLGGRGSPFGRSTFLPRSFRI